MKRVISLLLVCCFLAIALVACGGGEKKETSAPTNTGNEVLTDIYGQTALNSKVDWEELDFEGEEITVLVRNDEKVSREWEREDVGDDELDLAIANRNDVVEGNINVDVQIILEADEWHANWAAKFPTRITQDVDNGLHNIDLVANFGFNGMNSGLRDYYLNVHDKDTFPYFNFELMCWNQALIETGTVNGKLFGIVGDMNLSLYDTAMIIWHNKDLYDQLKTDKDPQDLQDFVIAGDWTYSELYKGASLYTPASTGAGDCSDIYGTWFQTTPYPEQPAEAIPYAFQLNFITTEANGTHSFNFVGNDRAEKALNDYRTLISSNGNLYHLINRTGTAKCTCGTGGHFVSGHILFKGDIIFWSKESNNAIREMEDTYALLCWPKYDEAQDHYATTSQSYLTIVSVLDHSKSSIPTKGEAISAYLQYANEYSYTHVRGYYFERIIKPKFFGTDDSDGHVTKSVTVFVNIIENLEFDFATVYSPMLEKVLETVWKGTTQANGTVEQKFNANKDAYESALKSLDEWFGLK